MSIAYNLRKYRMERKLSKQEVAESINIKPNTYASWEAGKTQPPADRIPLLAQAFGVGLEKLFEQDNSCQIKEQHNTGNNAIINNAREVKMDLGDVFEVVVKSKDETIATLKKTIELLQTTLKNYQ